VERVKVNRFREGQEELRTFDENLLLISTVLLCVFVPPTAGWLVS